MNEAIASLPPGYFEALYAADPDPWRFVTSSYERDKYVATLAALGERRFRRAFEVGCSIGVLTRRLAPRCDTLLAVDVVETALDQARTRCADLPQVAFAQLQVPQEWPSCEQRFDLILLSEVVYYLSPADVDALAARVHAGLEPGGCALLVHWLGSTSYPMSGDAATERFIAAATPALAPTLQQRRPEYRLDLLQAPEDAASG